MNQVLFHSSALPVLQNRVYGTPEDARACATGDIRLEQAPLTGIVTNMAFRPELMVYDTDYNNEQGNSARFKAHLDSVAELIAGTMGTTDLVEVGCGKGFFLERLLQRGFDVTGFDPTYEGSNPRVKRSYFAPGIAAPGQGLILRHVLEHIPDPLGFLHQLAKANQGRGLIYIEVPCLDWILDQRAWFDIFYEHVNYFRQDDFYRMFGRIVHAGHCFGGQYLGIVADLASLRNAPLSAAPQVTFPTDFSAALAAPAAGTSTGLPEVVWGGASKGVIYCLARQRAGAPVARVIDINPGKQGRYLPCTGVQVQSPQDGLRDLPAGATIHVMNPNYMDEIQATAGPDFHYVGASHE